MKCLALFSGGLDSMLAIKLMVNQGIDTLALYIDIGFASKDDKSEILEQRAKMAGAEFKIVDIKNEYLKNVLFTPKYGYGKNFNPCIDCHGYMFKTALGMLESENASFIVTGEVLGQRPMSQRALALKQVSWFCKDKEDLILRPMSAKLMEPTKPEILGWVDRQKLLDISGRSRTKQIQLAKEFGFEDYESPAGGCLLTMKNFSDKIKDALKFEKIENVKDAQILKFGRHLRLKNGAKMIIGRDEEDNNKIYKFFNEKFEEIKFKDDIVGAYSIISKNADNYDKNLAAKLALTYAKTDHNTIYDVAIGRDIYKVSPFISKEEAKKYFVAN